MGGKDTLDYKSLLKRAIELVNNKQVNSLGDVAKALKVNYNTMLAGFNRHFDIRNFDDLARRQDVISKKIEGAKGETIEVEFEGNFGELDFDADFIRGGLAFFGDGRPDGDAHFDLRFRIYDFYNRDSICFFSFSFSEGKASAMR